MGEENNKNMSQKEIWRLAVEIRKLEKRLKKIESLDEEESKATSFLLGRIYKIIEWYDVKIIDPTGQKFLEWMTWIDILSAETDKDLEYPIIWETTSPIVEVDWRIEQRAKVVIKTPEVVVEEKQENKEETGIYNIDKKKELLSVFALFLIALAFFALVRFLNGWLCKKPISSQIDNVANEEVINPEVEDMNTETEEIINEEIINDTEDFSVQNIEENDNEELENQFVWINDNQEIENVVADENVVLENVEDEENIE